MLDSHAAGADQQPTAEPRAQDEVPSGSISMSAGVQRADGTLFVQGNGVSFPLVTLGGATYRLLETPDSVSQSLLGAELGAVSEFNVEPALASSGIVSNIIACGESIYAVGDRSGALIAANVDGNMRLFQRVSYAGTAIIAAETLQDTLCSPDDVLWIDIAGIGRVDDPQTARSLMATLLELADYKSTAFSSGASMQIGLTNGLVLQLMAGEDSVSACGVWSCPDFFEEFAQAVK